MPAIRTLQTYSGMIFNAIVIYYTYPVLIRRILIINKTKEKMKKFLILSIVVLPLFFGCENKKQTAEIQRLQADSMRLAQLANEKEQAINDLFQTLNEIEENLATVRAKESLIADQTGDSQEMKADVKDRINQSIAEINQLMDKNKQLVNRLNVQVKNSNLKVTDLNKTVERMNETVATKEQEIAELKDNLGRLNIEIENLNVRVADLETESTGKTEMIDQKILDMNKVWYVVGDRRELRDKEIIDRQGGFIGIGKTTIPAENFVKNEFIEADMRQVTEIALNTNRVEVVTAHPAGSYELVGEDPIEKIVIKDPEQFWKASKYLVVSTR
jgi:predicted  nucleic acid-binding Zn-ribbon protein